MTTKRVDELFDLSKLSESSIRKYQVPFPLLRATSALRQLTRSSSQKSRITSITSCRLTLTMLLKNCLNSSVRRRATRDAVCVLPEGLIDRFPIASLYRISNYLTPQLQSFSWYENQIESGLLSLVNKEESVDFADDWCCILRNALIPKAILEGTFGKSIAKFSIADVVMEQFDKDEKLARFFKLFVLHELEV